MTTLRRLLLLVLFCLAVGVPVAAQPLPAGGAAAQPFPTGSAAGTGSNETPENREQLVEFKHALLRLPLAAVLAAALALRPRRRGTPPRAPAVVQTQIVLALIGCLVMLVVGSSLARAFGIVGAAGLVRYRARVNDPKDAGVMLSTLTVGLASGVGLWLLAIFGTAFILLVLWVAEYFEPVALRRFSLRIKTKDSGDLKQKLETLLKRRRATFEIRAVTPEELNYEVQWPLEHSTDTLSEKIIAMAPEGTEVELEQIKEKT